MTTPSIQTALPWRTYSKCLLRAPSTASASAASRRRFLSTSSRLHQTAKKNPLRGTESVHDPAKQYAQSRRMMTLSSAGIAVCAVAMYGVIQFDLFGLEEIEKKKKETDAETTKDGKKGDSGAMKMDGPDGFTSSPSVIRIQGQDGAEQVATGTSYVPYFPSTVRLPKELDAGSLKAGDDVPASQDEEEYQLLGLGIRTVSFLKIQVYVVGMYVAKSDISELQQRLVRTAVKPPGEGQAIDAPGATSATSLVSYERQQLKDLLLDPERGHAAWDAILKKDGLRTVFRIVPTRNTDFMHLRDAWVRAITGRAQAASVKAKEAGATVTDEVDESFGTSVNDFKQMFGRGQQKNINKGQAMLLVRNAGGELDALFHPDAAQPIKFLGRVPDERISRMVWLQYLAGKNVSSEGARQSVVDGVMGIVERPVGTVVQKVI